MCIRLYTFSFLSSLFLRDLIFKIFQFLVTWHIYRNIFVWVFSTEHFESNLDILIYFVIIFWYAFCGLRKSLGYFNFFLLLHFKNYIYIYMYKFFKSLEVEARRYVPRLTYVAQNICILNLVFKRRALTF